MGVGWLKESFVSIWRHCTGTRTETGGKIISLDKAFMRPLDFDLSGADSFVIPDYSGENRFSWADMSGELIA